MTNILTRDPRVAAIRRDRPVRAGLVLAVVLIGQFMAVLDASIVNVAAPSIHASLRASGAGLQLVVAGYTITYAVLLVTGARLGDIAGHRRVFLSGLVLFTLASLGCGLAASAGLLIALRFVQGAGAAMMIPQVLSLIQRTHTGPARARAMSLYAAVIAGGAVVGSWPAACWSARTCSAPAGGRSSWSTCPSACCCWWPGPGPCRTAAASPAAPWTCPAWPC
jgi:MFS family permease